MKDPDEVTEWQLSQSIHLSLKLNQAIMYEFQIIVKHLKKGYKANFIDEMFIVSDVCTTVPQSYEIVDNTVPKIIGAFYEDELR